MGLSLRGSTSGSIDIDPPAVAGNNTITLPGDNGSANQFFRNSTIAGIVTYSSMVEDSSGNIGIGTDNPATSLDIYGDSRLSGGSRTFTISTTGTGTLNFAGGDSVIDHIGNQLQLKTSQVQGITFTTNNNERLRITSDGNIGIGTDNPVRTLHVQGDARVGASGGRYILFGGGADYNSIISRDGVTGTSGHPLVFSTGTGASAESMRIDSSGRLGIGTDSPNRTLHVSGTTETPVQFQTSQANLYIQLENSTASNGYIGFEGTNLSFWNNGANRLNIDSSGRLLVGTANSPSAGDGVYSIQVIQGYVGDSTGQGLMSLQRGETASNITSNESIGVISFNDSDGYVFGQIYCQADANAGASDFPGRLVFSTTADSASSPTERMRIDNAGGVRMPAVYNQTTANAANIWIANSGQLYRSTSSIKYKTDVETLQDSYADAILNVRPVWYRSTCQDDNSSLSWWGFIAEEVAEIDPRLVQWKTKEVTYDDNGSAVETPCDPEPEGIAYDRFVPHLLNLIKRQKEQIDNLETRLAALEGGTN